MTWPVSQIDLFACATAALRPNSRWCARMLLARELVARLATGEYNYDLRTHNGIRFNEIYDDLTRAPTAPGLQPLLDAGESGGRAALGSYLIAPLGAGLAPIGSAVPQTPGPQAPYRATLTDVISSAASLVNLVVNGDISGPGIGNTAFQAARVPFVTQLQLRYPTAGFA
jgi:hypothetical protein